MAFEHISVPRRQMPFRTLDSSYLNNYIENDKAQDILLKLQGKSVVNIPLSALSLSLSPSLSLALRTFLSPLQCFIHWEKEFSYQESLLTTPLRQFYKLLLLGYNNQNVAGMLWQRQGKKRKQEKGSLVNKSLIMLSRYSRVILENSKSIMRAVLGNSLK